MNKDTFNKLTPAMRHYVETRNLNPDAFLFYRLGDFYEIFFEDAIEVSRLLDLTLTKKSGGLDKKIPMCGIPYRVVNQYVSRLVNMGYKVAICDQVEDPKDAKGLVKREITKIVTPATFTDTQYLKRDTNQYLMSLWIKGHTVSLAYCDYLSGEFSVDEMTFLTDEELYQYLGQKLSYIRPVELVYLKNIWKKDNISSLSKKYSTPLITELEENYLDVKILNKLPNLANKIKKSISINKISHTESILLLLNYLEKTQMNSLEHLTDIIVEKENPYMELSENSKYNLELIKSMRDQKKNNTLFEVLDQCVTSMGTRLLKDWIQKPLMDLEEILRRQNIIKGFHDDRLTQDFVKNQLKQIYDFDRLAVKISQKTLTPKNFDQLRMSLQAISKLRNQLLESSNVSLKNIGYLLEDMDFLAKEIYTRIIEDPPMVFTDERFIVEGFDPELDTLFETANGGLEWLLNLEKEEQKRTGIKNLKIKYNKILGYFFEVTKSNLDLVPDNYTRKQTLVGSERYFSTQLKEKESMILSGKEQAYDRQLEILEDLREIVFQNLISIQKLAHTVSYLDCIYALSAAADKYNFVCPTFNNQGLLNIVDGRHPMVEVHLEYESYVPNDVYMDSENYRIQIITGPNMSGKSTYMRQTAILCIMAQIGSFVPASKAVLPILDQIFTRIGASDSLASGQSTFMVEMMEVAYIISHASKDSLILLDEVGRGTSTHDGLSIASALVEFLSYKTRTKTFFATHYHELTQLKDKIPSIHNLTIATEEIEGDIRFLRKIIPGSSNHSYGIQVAKLAGVDQWITDRANVILKELEEKEGMENPTLSPNNFKEVNDEASIENPILKSLKNLDINSITPLEALRILDKYKHKIEEEQDE